MEHGLRDLSLLQARTGKLQQCTNRAAAPASVDTRAVPGTRDRF